MRGVRFALSSIQGNIDRPVAAMAAAYITDIYGLYPNFVTTSVIYFIGLAILQLGVQIRD